VDQLDGWPADAQLAPDDQINYHRAHGWPLNATQWLKDQHVTYPVHVNLTNTTYPCYSQYAFGDLVLGDLKQPVTVDFRLMNLSNMEAEVRYCVDHNPKYNGDLYVECRNGGLRVDNSSCYPDIYPPTMVDFHMGVFEPDPSFALNDTQFINVTYAGMGNPPTTSPWDQFILRFSETVKAGSGSVTITEINPPSVRRDYIGPIIDVPVDDYYQVFFGEDEKEWGIGVAVVKSKAGHLKTKDGGQMYRLDVPEGAILDRAGNPAHFAGVNQTSLRLEFKVMDIRPPHIHQDFVTAFFPKHGDTGRFVHHNITITLDEAVVRRGSLDAVIRLEPRITDDAQCYQEFKIHGCGPIYLDEDHAPIDIPLYSDQVVMYDRGTRLNDTALPGETIAIYPHGMEFGVTYAVVIQNADFQDASGLNFTGLGTLDNGLYWFTTATRKQMDLRTHIEFMTEYDERRLKDTMDMFHTSSSPMDMPWVDSFAQLRRLTLVWAIGEAKKILADPYGLPVESDLQLVVDELTKDRFEPRGVPFGDPWVCQDFQSHMLQSVGFTCQPAVQKSGNGFDIVTRTASFFYRDGCLCHSHYQLGCPFKTSASTSYQDFGFSAMEEKVVGPGDSLCWYWGISSNPEWGYLSHANNHFKATDPNDDERLVKEWWSWHAAHRPTEAAARDPMKDHYGIASLVHGRKQRSQAPVQKQDTVPSGDSVPASARRLRLKRTPAYHAPRPAVPKVTVPKVLDAIKRVLPTLPPEPPDQEPTRYPAAEAVPTPWLEPVEPPKRVRAVAPTAAERVKATPFPVQINPMVWYGDQYAPQ